MTYQLKTTATQRDTINWLTGRGYLGGMGELLSGCEWSDYQGGDYIVIHTAPEHLAWEVAEQERNDPHTFWTCAGEDIIDLIQELLEQIV